MTNKPIKPNYEDPVDDATEADVPEEFRYTAGRFKPILRDRFPQAMAHDMHPRNSRVRVEIQLDQDVLNYFKQRAALPHAALYERQINDELRRVMERDTARTVCDTHAAHDDNATREPSELYAALINDDNFINAIAERLSERQRKQA